MSKQNDDSSLIEFLNICGLPEDLIKKIGKDCNSSFDNFIEKKNNFSSFGLNKSQILSILEIDSKIRKGVSDIEEYLVANTSNSEIIKEDFLLSIIEINEIDDRIKKWTCKNYNKLKNKKIPLTIATYTAASSVAAFTCSLTGAIGAILCSYIPVFGIHMGWVLGTFMGSLLTKFYTYPIFKNAINTINSKIGEKNEEELYEYALKQLNLNRHSDIKLVKKTFNDKRLVWHPDKYTNLNEDEKKEYAEKFIQNETSYKIIENYRKARAQWE